MSDRTPGLDPPGKLSLAVTLDVRPLELIRPEPLQANEFIPHPLSFLMSLNEKKGVTSVELNSPRNKNWSVERVADGILEFRLTLPGTADSGAAIELVKRFRLGTPADVATEEEGAAETEAPPHAYHLDMELELRNVSDSPQRLAYSLSGPTGLPLEGWWYSAKIHPRMFYGAGTNVIIKTDNEWRMVGCPELYKSGRKEPDERAIPLFAEDEPVANRTVRYLAIDTQYFVAVLMPTGPDDAVNRLFDRAEAFALGDVSKQAKGYSRTTDVTYTLDSADRACGRGQPQAVVPCFPRSKRSRCPGSLPSGRAIYYGWFGWVAKPMLDALARFFYGVVGNYGMAIIMLTVLVRGCMFPLSRKQAQNAAKMQELQPEMKKLNEKYKNDLEKRAKAQQELFRKHNYNPLGGCLPMFIQLPIFIGLYRSLMVDVELRQAPLIPGHSLVLEPGRPRHALRLE